MRSASELIPSVSVKPEMAYSRISRSEPQSGRPPKNQIADRFSSQLGNSISTRLLICRTAPTNIGIRNVPAGMQGNGSQNDRGNNEDQRFYQRQRVNRRKPHLRCCGRDRRWVNPQAGNDGSDDSDHDDTHIFKHEDNQPSISAVSIGHHPSWQKPHQATNPQMAVVSGKMRNLLMIQPNTQLATMTSRLMPRNQRPLMQKRMKNGGGKNASYHAADDCLREAKRQLRHEDAGSAIFDEAMPANIAPKQQGFAGSQAHVSKAANRTERAIQNSPASDDWQRG